MDSQLPRYKDPEGLTWIVHPGKWDLRRGQLADLVCDDDRTQVRKNVGLPHAWEWCKPPELWYHLAPDLPVDRIGRIARSSSAHIHDEGWFDILKEKVWNKSSPSFINQPGADGITPLMHAALSGNIETTRALLEKWNANPVGPSGYNDRLRMNPPPNPFAAALELDRPDLLLVMVESGKLEEDQLTELQTRYTQTFDAPAQQRTLADAVTQQIRRRGM